MGNRLSKIATRTGDGGTTGLGDGSRTDKDSVRITSIGEVDELNSHIGLLLCEDMPADLREELVTIQHDLFDLGGELCIPGYQMIKEAHVERLDVLLAKYNATLPPLTEFILPAGSRAAAAGETSITLPIWMTMDPVRCERESAPPPDRGRSSSTSRGRSN